MPTFSATSLEKVGLFQLPDRQLTTSEISGLVKFTRVINKSSHFEHSSKYSSQSAHLEPNTINKKLQPYIKKAILMWFTSNPHFLLTVSITLALVPSTVRSAISLLFPFLPSITSL